jgi:hypothetical protein
MTVWSGVERHWPTGLWLAVRASFLKKPEKWRPTGYTAGETGEVHEVLRFAQDDRLIVMRCFPFGSAQGQDDKSIEGRLLIACLLNRQHIERLR